MRSVRIRCRASFVEASLVAVAAAWFLLAVAASLRSGGAPPGGAPVGFSYLAFAPMLLVGVALGHLAARRWLDPLVPMLLVFLGLMLFLGIPAYANAQAAGGVQLVAAAALMLAGRSGSTEVGRSGRPLRSRTEPVALPSRRALERRDPAPAARTVALTRALGVLIGVLGLVLAARSKAGIVLVLLALVLAVIVMKGRPRVSRSALLGVGLGAVGLAALSVVLLGSVDEWPERLTRAESLSSARHELWADAIALWRDHPFLGGGPGSFYVSSSLAGSDPLLYAAHSSILQVAAELGAIGALLLVTVLVAGAALAAQSGRSHTLIGVAAWCALAVHSMIDHLYEFPLVVLLAGVVIGWSGARSRASSVT